MGWIETPFPLLWDDQPQPHQPTTSSLNVWHPPRVEFPSTICPFHKYPTSSPGPSCINRGLLFSSPLISPWELDLEAYSSQFTPPSENQSVFFTASPSLNIVSVLSFSKSHVDHETIRCTSVDNGLATISLWFSPSWVVKTKRKMFRGAGWHRVSSPPAFIVVVFVPSFPSCLPFDFLDELQGFLEMMNLGESMGS